MTLVRNRRRAPQTREAHVLGVYNAIHAELNPDPNNLPKLDPKDQFLLGDPAATGPVLGTGSASGTSTPISSVPHVPWLRKTEYLSRDGSMRQTVSQEM